ncbi:MAG: hypothetical protein V7655_05010 [Aequorivita antarctica]
MNPDVTGLLWPPRSFGGRKGPDRPEKQRGETTKCNVLLDSLAKTEANDPKPGRTDS